MLFVDSYAKSAWSSIYPMCLQHSQTSPTPAVGKAQHGCTTDTMHRHTKDSHCFCRQLSCLEPRAGGFVGQTVWQHTEKRVLLCIRTDTHLITCIANVYIEICADTVSPVEKEIRQIIKMGLQRLNLQESIISSESCNWSPPFRQTKPGVSNLDTGGPPSYKVCSKPN